MLVVVELVVLVVVDGGSAVVVVVVGSDGCVVTLTGGPTGGPAGAVVGEFGAENPVDETWDRALVVDDAGAVVGGGTGAPVSGSVPARVVGGLVVVDASVRCPAVTTLGMVEGTAASVPTACGVRCVGRLKNTPSAMTSATPATMRADVSGSGDPRQR